MKPKTKLHLYESEHSGFYGDDSTIKVNLLPKSWTKYTVTDGDWMIRNTIDPLEKRDIFLANTIDKVDEDKRDHYSAGKHFIIDHEHKLMDANPFESNYTFTNGLSEENVENYIYVEFPEIHGSVENKLMTTNNGIKYDHYLIPSSERTSSFCDSACSSLPIFTLSKLINGNDITEEIYDDYFSSATMISISSLAGETNCYKYNDKIISGGWKYSMINEWNPELNERYIGPDENFNDSGTIRWENSSYYNVQSVGLKNNCFDPTDRTETVSSENYFNAGKNFISGNIDMVPSGILFIW